MDEVAATGQSIAVTRNGRPVAELPPIERPVREFFGRDHGKIVVHGDLDALRMALVACHRPQDAAWLHAARDFALPQH